MRQFTLLLTLAISFCSSIYGQKRYEMVIEKTDGTEIAIATTDIIRTYFREISDQDVSNQDIIGVWDLVKEEGYDEGYYSEDYKKYGALRYFDFKEDNTYVMYTNSGWRDGPSKWLANQYGTYSIDSRNKTFNLYGDYNGEYELIELSSSVLKIKESWSDGAYEISTFNKVDASVLPSNNQNDFPLVGTWCYGSSEEDAFGDMNNIEGYVFRDNGTCPFFAIYNKGNNKEIRQGTYTYQNGILVVVTNKTRTYNVTISGNCMTWTGDDNETLYTREGLTVDLGDNNGDNNTPETNDPEGTVGIECKSNTWLDLFDEAKSTIYCDKNIFEIHNAYVDVIDLGEVNGIGEITFPADIWSMWKKTATQTVGHGYIFRYTGASTNIIKYAVVYIVSKIMTSNMSYMIKYITPFELADTDIIPTGTYGEENRDNTNYFTFSANGSYISWKHYVNDRVEQNSIVESEIKTDIDYIYVAHGDKIILSSSDGSTILNYRRDGKGLIIGSKSYVKLQQIVENHH